MNCGESCAENETTRFRDLRRSLILHWTNWNKAGENKAGTKFVLRLACNSLVLPAQGPPPFGVELFDVLVHDVLKGTLKVIVLPHELQYVAYGALAS